MANVWFVRRIGRDWKKLSDEPIVQRPLGDLIFKLDLGPQRRLGLEDAPEPAAAEPALDLSRAKAFVEVTPEDLKDALFPAYFPGWYESPYSAAEVARRLGEHAVAAHHP